MIDLSKTLLRFAVIAVPSLLLSSTSVFAADTTSNTNISPAERAKIESVVHDYLLQKPEVLVQALQVLQRKQYEQAEQTVKQTQQTVSKYAKALFMQPNDPVAGNPNGTISIVEFFDYQCPHCVEMAPLITAAIKTNPNLRFVFKEFPIRGPLSELAARAALAANLQGKYYAFQHALLTSTTPLSEDSIYTTAKNVGLNVDQLKKDMNDKRVSDQLKANIKLAQDLKLFGTPAFFFGKSDGKGNITYVPGQINQVQMDNAIANASK